MDLGISMKMNIFFDFSCACLALRINAKQADQPIFFAIIRK